MGVTQSNQNRLLPQPETIAEFRKLEVPVDHYVIPELPGKRKPTDSKFFIAFAGCLLILLPFVIYTLVNSDIDRLIHGYDKCGNICGKNNSPVDGIPCSGKDRTNEPLLEYQENSRIVFNEESRYIRDKCVSECDPQYEEIFNTCFPVNGPSEKIHTSDLNKFFSDVASDINKSAGYIVALCFIGFGFSVGMLLLFRYFVAVVVWVIIIGSLFGIIALTILFWCLDSTSLEYNRPFKPVAIFFTIISLVLVIMLVCMFKRIQLVIRLFKEAIKVLFGIPLIFFEPLLTFFAVSVLFIIFVYYFILMETAGVLQNVGGSLYEYTPNMVMLFTIWFHFVMCIWMEQFIIGCQHMVISGAVSAYYFARDKSAMISPIYNSFYNLFRYHLGTVAFGSLIITVITIIKALIRSLANSRQTKILVDCCLGAIEDFLKYLSKNAYIQTAIHGQPFYKSGKRAVRLLAANALSAVAINSVGDFVLFMAKLLIVVCTIGVGILMNDSSGVKHFWAPIFISAFVTAIIAECFFTVFETAIDTLFICFCEDSCMNDGMDRPYYMSVNLMQYIEDAKKTVKDKN